MVIVAATFGHGEPTDNAKTFRTWLMDPAREMAEVRHPFVSSCTTNVDL